MSFPRYLEKRVQRFLILLPRPETLTGKWMTPLYLGIVFMLTAGIIPLLIALNQGSGYVQVAGGQYFLGDYAVFVVMRFIIIIVGVMLFYIIYLRPKEGVKLMPVVLVMAILMWYI